MMYMMTEQEHAQIVDALETALDNAQQVAHDTHEQFKGYKPHRHAAVDKDVSDTEAALAALKAMQPVEPSESVEHRDELAKRKPEPAAETVGGLANAVKAARGGDAPPAPMRRFA